MFNIIKYIKSKLKKQKMLNPAPTIKKQDFKESLRVDVLDFIDYPKQNVQIPIIPGSGMGFHKDYKY